MLKERKARPKLVVIENMIFYFLLPQFRKTFLLVCHSCIIWSYYYGRHLGTRFNCFDRQPCENFFQASSVLCSKSLVSYRGRIVYSWKMGCARPSVRCEGQATVVYMYHSRLVLDSPEM